VGGLLIVAGCQAPLGTVQRREASPWAQASQPRKTEIDPTQVPTRDDIVSIIHYWEPLPWVIGPQRNPIGFRAPTYFVSGQTDRGAFVSGPVTIRLFVLERAASGARVRREAHAWELDESQAMNFRVRRRAVGGYWYGFILTWPDALDLGGKMIEIEFSYRRPDGRVVSDGGHRLRVPIGSGSPASAPVEDA
jgi:hypothetical protein